jgi:transposase-like protein
MTADNTIMKSLAWVILLTVMAIGSVSAAQREAGGGNAKIVNKLQAMVKEATSERDLLKTENAKVSAELETLKGQIQQDKDMATAAQAAQDKLAAELAAQKVTGDEVRVRLDNTTAKLREVIEKYNALNKDKNELAALYANLQNSQQATASELKSCEAKNIKMFEGAKAVMDGYQNCQKRGILDTLMGTEPFSQIKDVEFETAMQSYEDKLRKQKYQSKAIPVPVKVQPASASQVTPKTATPVASPKNTVSGAPQASSSANSSVVQTTPVKK